jgi:hypothetical protein
VTWLGSESESGQTGVYFDEKGHPMSGSALVRDPKFDARVVTETRALLAVESRNSHCEAESVPRDSP